MVAAFLGFVAGAIVGLQEFGFGLAVAIFIDVTIVRCAARPEPDGALRPLELVAAAARRPARARPAVAARRATAARTAPRWPLITPRYDPARCRIRD